MRLCSRIILPFTLLALPGAAPADLAFIGQAPASIQVLNDSGRKVPLSDALRRIAPKGWKGYAKKDAGIKGALVSWDDGQTWLSALDRISDQADLHITINWDEHILSVESLATAPPPVAPPAVPAVGRGYGPNPDIYYGQGSAYAPPMAQMGPSGIRWAPQHGQGNGFSIPPGVVSDAYARVAQAYGYKLDWRVKEEKGQFQFDNPIALPAAGLAEDLAKLNEAFTTSTGQQLFSVEVWEGNHIILVKNKE